MEGYSIISIEVWRLMNVMIKIGGSEFVFSIKIVGNYIVIKVENLGAVEVL